MPNQADTETPAESEPEAADTLISGQNEAEPEPENGSVPTAEFKPSGNAGIIEQPEAGAMFQLYLSGAGSYDAAKDSERDLLVTDENGVALSKDRLTATIPYTRSRDGKDRPLFRTLPYSSAPTDTCTPIS